MAVMDGELLVECKNGLGMQDEETAFNRVLIQKIVAVKSFMRRAGVSELTLTSEDAVGVIVLGVTDLWHVNSGEVKFSPVFYTLVNQLAR